MDYLALGSILLFFTLVIVLVVIIPYEVTVKVEIDNATVTGTYLDSGTSHCYVDRHGNSEDISYCPAKIGQTISIYKNGFGSWRYNNK